MLFAPKQKADDKVEDLVASPVCGAYGEAGVNHILIGFEDNDLQRALDSVEQFATDVIPLVG